jgi:outer membrane receptor protein involved in Fe transport
MNTTPQNKHIHPGILLAVLTFAALAAWTSPALVAQTTEPKNDKAAIKPEDVTVLSPFEVMATKDNGYAATSSLAGSRLNTSLKDVASAISVVTSEFMKDTGATDLQHILVYQTDTEVSGIGGNFYGGNADDNNLRTQQLVNPQNGTRVRGLNTADLTRDFFATNIPMDAYNTSRVDIQRGPNSILFGLGSPAGIINNTLKDPNMKKAAYAAQLRFGSYGSKREVLDIDVPLITNTLGLRIIGLDDKEKYRQDFTFNHDKRVYGALRWTPVLADHVFTQIDVKAETGKIDANRPVAVTAADFISNWFNPVNKYLSYNPLTDNGLPVGPDGVRHDELRHYFAGAPARDWWNDSPATIFQTPTTGAIGNGIIDAYRQRDGVPWGGLSGVTNPNYDEGGSGPWNKDTVAYYANNPIASQIINQYQTATGKTFGGFGGSLWPTQMILSGPLAFIDKTMQGPNKKEWNNFDSINLDVTQTYLDNRLGFNVAYDRQNYRSGYANAISTDRVTVDVNTTLRDGSANPDVGRPVIIGPSSGNMTSEKREAYRGTGFYKFNLRDYLGKDSILPKIFGEQTFTGVLSSQRYANFSRSFNLYAWDANSYGGQYEQSPNYKSWWGSHYIGSSLMNVANFGAIPSSAIQGVTAIQTPAASSNTLLWDNTTQSWHNATVTIDNWQSDINKLYTGAAQGFDDTKSKSFVWQGRLLNDAIIPMFGWRKDAYTRMDKPSSLVRDQYGAVMPYSPNWTYTGTTPLSAEEQRRSWGWVVHTNPILDLFHYQPPLGLDVSFIYNDSNSFRPSDVGTDVYGKGLAAPSGQTRDKGILISALDNKISLRVTWYKTTQKNTTLSDPSGMVYWNKAGVTRTMDALAMEAWGPTARTPDQTTPEALVNKWFFGDSYDKSIASVPLPANWQSQLSTLVTQPLRIRHAAVAGDPTYVAQGTINPNTGSPYLAPFLNSDEMAYRQAWFAARTDAEWFRPLDPTWVKAEQITKITGDDYRIWGESPPSGEKLTNDLVSKGVEYELTANPTSNWRLTFNASRNEAVRSNILPDWSAFIQNSKSLWFDGGFNTIPVDKLNYWNITGFSQIRHWPGDTGYSGLADTFGGRMMQNVYGPYQNAIAANGQAVNELRKWRWNLVQNYRFDSGLLKNVNIGGAVRWQDKAAIGYFPKYNSDANIWVTDVNKPIYAPSETNYDAWIGYERKVTNKITWIIQLNVRDLFAKTGLIPIAANPDGTVAQARIPSRTTWALTNTFEF